MDRPITEGPWFAHEPTKLHRNQWGVVAGKPFDPSVGAARRIAWVGNQAASSFGMPADVPGNAQLIAAAGTVANQLYDSGLDGIEAVKSLPELIQQLKALRGIIGEHQATPPYGKTIAELCETDMLLARLKGDAE